MYGLKRLILSLHKVGQALQTEWDLDDCVLSDKDGIHNILNKKDCTISTLCTCNLG